MGIQSREYYRDDQSQRGYRALTTRSVVTKLIIINAAVFIAQNAYPPLTDWLSLGTAHKIAGTIPPDFIAGLEKLGFAPPSVSPGTRVRVYAREGDFVRVYAPAPDHRGYEELLLPANAVVPDYSILLQFWRLITAGFCHSTLGIQHILFNMFALWMFGRLVEPVYGAKEFLAFYLTAIIASGFGFYLVQVFRSVDASMIGASGGVMAVTIMAAMLYPREKVLLFMVIPVEFRWMAVLYVLLDLSGMTQAGQGDNIAHSAHLAGALFGFLYVHFNWRLSPLWERVTSGTRGFKLPGRRPKVRIHEPSIREPEPLTRADLSQQVDAILEKIHAQGEASLTDAERTILKEASHRFKR